MHSDYANFLLAIAARTATVLFWIVILLRIMGKRQIAQMNVYDLVLIMCLANAVQNAMTMGKGHLSVGLVSAGVMILIGRLLAVGFVRSPTWERRLTGAPTLLASEGKLIQDRLKREHVTDEEFDAALRQHGLSSVSEVKMAVLEPDGSISIIPRERSSA